MEVAMKASTIISMVPTSKHVHDVYLGEKGVIQTLKKLDQESRKETLCLDESTIEQSVSKATALKLRETGADMMDAPVSGGASSCNAGNSEALQCHTNVRVGVVGARDGTLAIMVGGDEASFQRALPVLQPMARKVTYCGDLGAGLAAKLSNK